MRTPLTAIALLVLVITCSSCSKISSDVRRDLILKDSVEFEIPILNSIKDTTQTTTGVDIPLDLDNLNPDNTENFSRENITRIRISSFRMVLIDSLLDSATLANNNFSNLQRIKAELVVNGKGQNFANLDNSSTSLIKSYNLIVNIPQDTATKYLLNPSVTYTFRYKARTETKTVLKAKAFADYVVTLEK